MRRFTNVPWLRGAVILGVLASLAAGLLVSNAGAVAEKKEVSKKKLKKAIAGVKGQIAGVQGQITTVEAAKLGNDVTEVTEATGEDSNTPKLITATCPAGKIAVGGGANILGAGFLSLPPAETALQISRPTASPSTGPINAWFAYASETSATGSAWSLTAHVLCATP